MKKIVTVLGARPQFIKAAVVSRNLLQRDGLHEIIIHTGQHFDANMSDVFFEEMDIPKPNYNLNINGLSHGAMTGQMLQKIEEVLMSEKPDYVLVYGDTNSTLAGALAAKKIQIPIAHVEAGLRSYNMTMPEEINRILTGRISDLQFCPTQVAVENLIKEGYEDFDCQIINSGDVMLDAAIFYSKKAAKPKVDLPETFILCTIHRSENTDDSFILGQIMEALQTISSKTKVVIPIHPRTKKMLMRDGYNFNSSNILFIEPVGYFEMIYLLKESEMVITDSGGLQKEAFFFKKHCLIIRNETEWIELVNGGYNFICGTNPKLIIDTYEKVKGLGSTDFSASLYGDGNAGKIIADTLTNVIL